MIDWSLAERVMPGAHESGDLHVVHEFSEGLLIGVMDGLGHGPEAAVASRRCASILTEYAGEPLGEIVARCHEGLRGTRGAALSLCTFKEGASAWSWTGVGNVYGVLLREGDGPRRQRELLLQQNGVVGSHMPKPVVSTLAAVPGDVLILATDGVRTDGFHELHPQGTPQGIAERILEGHATGTDDALVLVARYVGGLP